MNKTLKGIFIGLLLAVAIAGIGIGIYLIASDKKDTGAQNPESPTTSGSQVRSEKNTASGTVNVGDSDEAKKFESKYSYIKGLIDGVYLNESDEQKMYDYMLMGMVASLEDPYSVYYTPEEFAALMETTSGSYCGIGTTVSQNMSTKVITVVQPFVDSPAYKAGLQPGDIIVSVDGEDVVGLDVDYVATKMKGEKGTTVRVGVVRDTEELEFCMVRDEVEVECVTSKMLDDNIGYINILQFYELTSSQLEKEMTGLISQGAERVIIDLRDNPGGLYDDVVRCLDFFTEKNSLLIYTEDKNGKREEDYAKNDVKFDLPIVIMQNGMSASAAEIFAGTMQHYKKAVILGTQSFGKGIVQAVYPILTDGSGVKLTMAKYYIPSGVCIHEIGITPDIEVELEEGLEKIIPSLREHDNQLDRAIEEVKKIKN